MVQCSAFRCGSNSLKNVPGISFHRFPKDEEKRSTWVKNMKIGKWSPTQYDRICSKHFEERFFYKTDLKIKLLNQAIPTIFPELPVYLQIQSKKERSKRIRPTTPEPLSSTDGDEETESPRKKRLKGMLQFTEARSKARQKNNNSSKVDEVSKEAEAYGTNKICRLCAQLIKGMKPSHIFNDVDLAEKINDTLPITVNPGDGLPHFICNECEIKLNNLHSFLKQVIDADNQLRTKENSSSDQVSKTIEEIFGADSDDELNNLKLLEKVKLKRSSVDSRESKRLKAEAPDSKCKHSCEKCDASFQEASLLLDHYKTKHEIEDFHCLQTEKTKDEKLSHENVNNDQELPVICYKCNKIFLNQQALIKHQRNKHSSRVCTYCWMTFENEPSYKMHMYQHNNSNYQQCTYCNKAYNTVRGLKKHTLHTHRDEIMLLMATIVPSNEL